jgi:diguanylate cyclase (GGDEF)-like protein
MSERHRSSGDARCEPRHIDRGVPAVSTWVGEDSLAGWDGLPVAILVLDEHLLEVAANRAWRALTGAPEGESNWLDALAPDTRLLAVEQLGTVLAGKDLAQVEWRLARDDVSWVLVGATVHSGAGGRSVVVAALDRSVSHQREERLERRMALDPLTGALTGSEFTRLVRMALTRRHAGPGIGMIFIDIDGFKAVNDSYGHLAGDELLSALAARLRAELRPGDALGRMGGDEFVVLCHDLARRDEIHVVAARLIATAAIPFALGGIDIEVAISAGIAMAGPADTAESLLDRSDTAMYQAKRDGGGRFHHRPLPTVRRRA